MNTRFTCVAAALAAFSISPVTAQIPDGWAVGSAFKQYGYTKGGGGVTVFHPHRAVRWQVQGLPSDLTGVGASSVPVHGAYNILIRPSDRRLFVGELSLIANDVLEIHEFSVVGRLAVGLKRHRIGTNDSTTRDVLIGGMQWLPNGRILFVHFGAKGSALGKSNLAILDPATSKVTPVPITGISPSGRWNALTLDAKGTTAYFAVNQRDAQRKPVSTKIYSVAVPTGGTAVLVGQRTRDIAAELDVEENGALVAILAGTNPGLHRLAATKWTRITPVGVNVRGTMRIDAVTGHYVARVDLSGQQTLRTFDRNGRGTVIQTLPRGSEVIVGIDIMPSMRTYGTESPGAYRWAVASNPGGAPMLGNANFAITATTGGAPLPGWVLLGVKPINLKVAGIRLLVGDIVFGLPLPATSTATMALPIPTTASLAGVRIYTQVAHARGTTLIASKGLVFTLF